MSFDLKISGGDILLDSTGNPILVFDLEKLRQEIVKMILTPLGTNKRYPWYGSPLSEKTIGKVLEPTILNFEMKSSIMYAINNIIELQKLQKKDGQYTSPGETISEILDIQVSPSIYDARQYDIFISVSTRRGDVVKESFTLTL